MTERRAIRISDLLPEGLSLGPAVDQEMRDNPNSCPAGLAWDFIADEASGVLRGLLDCDLIALLAQGWAKANAIRAYADPAKHPPGETAIVHLAEHEFVREVHPVLKVSVAGCPPFSMRFTLALTAKVRGLALSIESGHILAGSAGDASVSAQLKYGACDLTDAKESRKVALPGRFVFTPSIPIPPPANGA
ncbi:MAG: hypothetical protein E6G92_09555 [Alphaproteobacteria bacterium]|nr:MAG: hypothetical protein E6G92_09555 [Alphaproteobacteria bacterium]